MTAEDRVAIVTGGGSGIGQAAARRLADLGVGVVVVGRRAEAVAQVARAITGSGGCALAVPADLGDPSSPPEVVSRALERFGRLDIVVNNAAVIQTGPLDSVTPELIDHHYAVNVRARCF